MHALTQAGSGVLTRLSGFVPESLRIAAVAGIGVFISLVGATNVKLIEAGAIGNLEDPAIWLFVGGACIHTAVCFTSCCNRRKIFSSSHLLEMRLHVREYSSHKSLHRHLTPVFCPSFVIYLPL